MENGKYLFLRKHGGKYGTFIGAVSVRDIDAVKLFLDGGADVNEKVQHGLHLCMRLLFLVMRKSQSYLS